jgi:hypothetical protein
MADHRVAPLKKSDLQYPYARGAAGDDDPSKREIPDSIELNRSEWYEMLYFCNKFANECGKGSKEIALKAERLIHEQVPANLHGTANIRDWLLRNWQMFPKG